MRITSYVVTFIFAVAILTLNIISSHRVDWLVVKSPEILHTRVTTTYGLSTACTRSITRVPTGNGSEITYGSYECRKFPKSDTEKCEDTNRMFCAAWTSAKYVDELGIGFGIVSLLAVLVGVTAHTRRRRIWRACAGLILLQALCQLIAFAIVTDAYSTSPYFEQARPGVGYVLNIVSWTSGILVVLGVVTTGLSADYGHRWAAGNRAYQPIPDQ